MVCAFSIQAHTACPSTIIADSHTLVTRHATVTLTLRNVCHHYMPLSVREMMLTCKKG